MNLLLGAALCLAVCVVPINSKNTKLREVFSWNIMDYAWQNDEDRKTAVESGEFIPENNLPLGLEVWKNKLFITIPRWKKGVISTLNYIDLEGEYIWVPTGVQRRNVDSFDDYEIENDEEEKREKKKKKKKGSKRGKDRRKKKKKKCKPKPKPTEPPTTEETETTPTEMESTTEEPMTTIPPPAPRSPPLIPYPSFEDNRVGMNMRDGMPPIVSVFRVWADVCDRLWVMDTGVDDVLGSRTVITKPRILIFDLNTDELIKTYEFRDADIEEHSFFANIIVDVDKDDCEKAFAYVPDLGGYGVVVYDFRNERSKRMKHNYFHFDPLAGNMVVGGVNFQWTDGVFSIALSKPMEDGFRTAYFHPLASTKEFSVSTKVLQSGRDSEHNFYDYKVLGDRGEDSQSSASYIDPETGIMFYTQLQKDSVNCWNTNKPFKKENLDVIASDNETMIFTNDLKVDRDGNLWVLSDRLPTFIYRNIDDTDVNYRIFKTTVKRAVAGTKCAN